MAYEGGGLLQFLKPDLSTRAGAQSAMDLAKFGFLLVAGFRAVIYGILMAGGLALSTEDTWGLPLVFVGVVLVEVGLPLVAAWRLHVYKGAFVVPVVTAIYVVGILGAPSIGSVVIGAVFTAIFIGGIRGAWALRRGTGFEDDLNTTFV